MTHFPLCTIHRIKSNKFIWLSINCTKIFSFFYNFKIRVWRGKIPINLQPIDWMVQVSELKCVRIVTELSSLVRKKNALQINFIRHSLCASILTAWPWFSARPFTLKSIFGMIYILINTPLHSSTSYHIQKCSTAVTLIIIP